MARLAPLWFNPPCAPATAQPLNSEHKVTSMSTTSRPSGRFGIRVGEALVAGGPPGTAAEPEVAIGEMDGPFGTAFATLLGDQVKGHSRVLSLLNTDVMVRPPTICVSKVTVENERYTNILMGTVQY